MKRTPSIFLEVVKPAVKLDIHGLVGKGFEQLPSFNSNEGKKFFLTPAWLILYSFIAYVLWQVAKVLWGVGIEVLKWIKVYFSEHDFSAVFIGIGIVLVLGAILYFQRTKISKEIKSSQKKLSNVMRERQTHKRTAAQQFVIAEGERKAALAERTASALVCGDAPLAVELKAIPQELRTVHMTVSDFLRKVCRPFVR